MRWRMILDPKRSRIKCCSAKRRRVLLPRLLYAITQTLYLMASIDGLTEADTEYFVLDFTEAVWQMPLHPDERRFF